MTSQNVSFADQADQWNYTVPSMPDATYDIAKTDDADLNNFLSRPLKIQAYSWSTGSSLYQTFNPWDDFFSNPRVINRITNFNLLRCKLRVKIVVNGNGFYYGRAIASYKPLHNLDDFTQDRPSVVEDITAASQRPHIYIDPTNNQGGELCLPFVWYENALNIPSAEWTEMGDMIIHSMQDLKHANGATDPITISVFAWAEDVSLSIPTSLDSTALTPQMAEVDEYGSKPVSNTASIVAKVSGMLSKAPGIGPYAMATSIAANAVSSIARLFGYARPAVLEDIRPYKPTYCGNLANVNVGDSVQRLTLDAKQELTIDPRVVGLDGTDELDFKAIASRESYLTQFGWQVSDAVETLLWNTEVNPVIWTARNVAPGVDELHFPACAFAAMPFRWWRGTMKFRFQVVASAYHKGRLKIVYDPHNISSNEYNTNYMHIVDLAKERDFTISVGWGVEKMFSRRRKPGVDGEIFGINPVGDPTTFGNGTLSVFVVNDLTVPNSVVNNDIAINVFVSMDDDFEVGDLNEELDEYSWFKPQLGEIFNPQMAESHPDADSTIRESEPMKEVPTTNLAPVRKTNDILSVFFGDPILSFRQLLKRYCYHTAYVKGGNIYQYSSWINDDFPFYRGYAAGGIHAVTTPVDPTAYNFSKMTMLNWVTPAFEARRGSLRWKYLREGFTESTEHDMMLVARVPNQQQFAHDNTSVLGALSSTDEKVAQAVKQVPSSWPGAAVTAPHVQPALEIELPFYSNVRFFPAKKANITYDNSFAHKHKLVTKWKGGVNDIPMIHSWCATGEDFQLSFFTGAPVCYLQTDPTAT